jgi:hypothetical protein
VVVPINRCKDDTLVAFLQLGGALPYVGVLVRGIHQHLCFFEGAVKRILLFFLLVSAGVNMKAASFDPSGGIFSAGLKLPEADARIRRMGQEFASSCGAAVLGMALFPFTIAVHEGAHAMAARALLGPHQIQEVKCRMLSGHVVYSTRHNTPLRRGLIDLAGPLVTYALHIGMMYKGVQMHLDPTLVSCLGGATYLNIQNLFIPHPACDGMKALNQLPGVKYAQEYFDSEQKYDSACDDFERSHPRLSSLAIEFLQNEPPGFEIVWRAPGVRPFDSWDIVQALSVDNALNKQLSKEEKQLVSKIADLKPDWKPDLSSVFLASVMCGWASFGPFLWLLTCQ